MSDSMRNLFFRKNGRRSSVPARRHHDAPLAVTGTQSPALLEPPSADNAQRRKSAYVPKHAASDFGNMPVATSYRESPAYSWRNGHPAAEYPRPWFQFEDIKSEDKSSDDGYSRPDTPETPSTTTSFTSPWSRRASTASTSLSGSEPQSPGLGKRRSIGQKVSEYFRPPPARGHTRNSESVSSQSITFFMDE